MALNFVPGSTEYLTNSSATVTGTPFTFSAWLRLDSGATGTHEILLLSNTGSTSRYFVLLETGLGVWMQARQNSFSTAISTGTVTLGNWHHCCGVAVSSTDISVFIDGGDKVQSTTDITPTGIDTYAAGALVRSSAPIGLMDGDLAELALYDVALTDAEVATLAAGYSPLFVRPQSLVSYHPLFGTLASPSPDRMGSMPLTHNGTPTKANHPPIIYPSHQILQFPPVVAAGGSVTPYYYEHLLAGAA